ncbi:AcrR family transcriptional regulator [Streptomyces sp. 3330]|uniref:TetR/AcrR family transcriptional regulator n=1 Tax=Streptomyces sp. 3330 TaxID=2817755 RepID=UPI00285D59F8|nr:TetR family transcriptional regulator [Streptomyces sp. 3330]MDR6974817.1 AcrR family transcriptional regulator [Streptomyces sp. 3330]
MISSTSPSASGSLTERRKAATRMEIARAAAGLFVSRGLKATRAEDIALAAGIAPRTFYRYFATKEEAVAPLYAAGAQRWAEAVREAPAGLTVPEALEHAVQHTLVPGRGVSAASWEWVRTLIRLAGASPALGKVWAEVCHTSEATLAEVLAERTAAVSSSETPASGSTSRTDRSPADAQSAPETAAADSGAAPEPAPTPAAAPASWPAPTPAASASGPAPTPAASASGPAPTPAASAPASTPAASHSVPDNVASPYQRFTAAVAGAAVRVAVESWAETNSPPTGRQGPAELALRNLRALHGFAWGEGPAEEA